MSWSIAKGETYIIDDNKRLKFSGATLHRYHVTVVFYFITDIVERIVIRRIDNQDCMYIGNVLHFSSKDILNKLIDDIIKEVT